jgi:V/A-type H+-transporting ATPase subunit E
MSDQLQDLLQRVYDEGVAKAKAAADEILAKARSEAKDIVAKAEAQAGQTLSDAEKRSQELKKNTDSDLKMAAQHTLSSLKQKITDLLLEQSFDARLKQDFSDPAFLKEMIKAVLATWKESGGRIAIAKDMEGKLEGHFLASLKDALGQAPVIEFSPAMKQGFSISPADGGYKLSFTDEDFANLFKSFLRPRTAQFLFGN